MSYFGIIGIKKLLFAFNLVFLNDYPKLNLIVFIILNFLFIAYISKIKPHKTLIHHSKDILTDIFLTIIYSASYYYTLDI